MGITKKPSPALVVATVAVALAGGGGAIAGGLITSANIQDNTVRGVDIRNGTIKPIDLAPVSRTMAWHGSTYARIQTTGPIRNVAVFEFRSPTAGYVVVNADLAVRVRNKFDQPGSGDCRVQTQISPDGNFVPPTATSAAGYADQWVNGNLPTQDGAGTYIQLNQSTNRVMRIQRGLNRIYIVGRQTCGETFWGPVNVAATYVSANPTAKLIAIEP